MNSTAQSTLYLASSYEVEGISGKYFDRKKAIALSQASYDEAAQQRLWAESTKLVGLAG